MTPVARPPVPVTTIGTPGTAGAVRLVLLGSGELGREVALEAVRLGCEVVAVDRYDGAPAMALAHRRHVVSMSDPDALRAVLEEERGRPCAQLLVVPEIEAIATAVLEELEADGLRVVPTARAARLTMDREGIRRLVAEDLGLPTSPYRFCDTEDELAAAVAALGGTDPATFVPCVVKPVMSSSGKGQSVVREPGGAGEAWRIAQEGGRVGAGRVICEGFVTFDYEITLLTVRHAGGTAFCAPIGHVQEGGDYRESWQPQPMSATAAAEAERVARIVTDALGGWGIFGVELFVRGDEVLFSEVSPRPHDTGMVTLASQALSEFALHVRAILGLPVGTAPGEDRIPLRGTGASAVVLGTDDADAPGYGGAAEALAVDPSVELRLFGKPDARPGRRLGVALALGEDVTHARERASAAAARVAVRP
ncbi:formate-dependent phosphoribosylglycinamide formyltransferase [Patulibacter brassicae]|uniref:Formate-dependent phosphoribosylglycinamide formyltransferase n=1 Tax=Patulibacter brassicae TaxID=1705717 RepID=A0ABU4VFK2_9ACTN|nr:formate-dependent phosphoribosylglycinamide formyltransferase [Patulibacter brassicae]MDX8150595.1 formate-dependent phosphoribosylglycinamide formyltransferase [Patulibacter brassicae]